MMTRRELVLAVGTTAFAAAKTPPVVLPVQLIIDNRLKWPPEQIARFRLLLWADALNQLSRCGIQVDTVIGDGGVWRPSQREPIITGLQKGRLNVVVTDQLPVTWDAGRNLCGVTTLYRQYHLCVIALTNAHANQIPFLSVNTCLHEMLHALLGDIFESRPGGVFGEAREARVDYHATSLWLFHADSTVRQYAESYVAILKAAS